MRLVGAVQPSHHRNSMCIIRMVRLWCLNLGSAESQALLQAAFKREVAETVLRCAAQGFDPSFAVVELNGLKIAEDKTFADCASAILTTVLGLCFPAPPRTKAENAALYPAAAADVSTQACCCWPRGLGGT